MKDLPHRMLVSKRLKILIIFSVLTVIFVAFLPCLNDGFVPTWDDSGSLTENMYVRSLTIPHVKAMFSMTAFKAYFAIPYIPLTLLSYALEYKFFGYNPVIYHLDNVLLHLAVVALIFLFIQKMGLSFGAAMGAALLFGIHPMHVESVVWVTERKDVLYAFFYLLALRSYLDYIRTLNKTAYSLTILWGLLSILSKPMALSLPLMLFVCDWWYKRRWSAGVFIEKIPHILYMAAIAWITYTKYMKPVHTDWPGRILIWVWNFIFYIEKFIFPAVLLPHYELPQPILYFHPAYIGTCCLFIIFLYSIMRFHHNRLFMFAWLFYFVSIFFMIRFENVILAGNLSVVADRFMYLPSLGFCIFLGVYLERSVIFCVKQLNLKKVLCLLGICFIFISLATKTFFQCQIWKNDISLWSYLVGKAPGDPLGYINRALGYGATHQYALALDDDTRALRINPHYYISSRNPKNEYIKRADDINLALANNPFLVVAYRNRGFVYTSMGKDDLAIKDFNTVLAINPKDEEIKQTQADLLKARLLGYRS